MLHDELKKYINEVETIVRELEDAYVEKYEEEILSDDRLNLRIRIRFAQGHLLEINESIIYDKKYLQHLSYRYHFQSEKNDLIFRYDNTPHFSELESFPHHKHTLDTVISTKKPLISAVFEEIKKYI